MTTKEDQIDYEVFCMGGIEIFIFGAEGNSSGSGVFVTHGRGGKVSDIFPYCRDLRNSGLTAIAVEERNHGRRLVDPSCNEGWGPHHAADMYGLFLGTALDVSLLLDLLPARAGISLERVGMTGVSLGGHATLVAMALDSRINVGVPVIGSGDYRQLMELRAASFSCPPESFGEYFPPALERAVQKFDPIHHAERFADRPLLMLNGGADTVVPAACNVRLEQALRPHYRHPERLKLSVHAGVGHAVPRAMWAEAKEWLVKWLLSNDFE